MTSAVAIASFAGCPWAMGLIPLLPLAAFAVLALGGGRLGRRFVAVLGVAPTAVSAVLAGWGLAALHGGGPSFSHSYWTWMRVGNFGADFALRGDWVSLTFATVVGAVGLAILLYSVAYMAKDDGYARYFAFMNLFIASMLTLVTADNLLLTYLGWEGVGLCSYLLIGFWHDDLANVRAARKAFIVTRIGDTALAIGVLILATQLGSLRFGDLQQSAAALGQGSELATAVALLILAGAIGKSAQLPLQTWLPDAMAGPTPVSALIHAATMVTAGVYLLVRMGPVMAMSPVVMDLTAAVGAATLVYAGLCACAQNDLKRILAYSTISQIGYMFLAAGAGAGGAAVYHFVTHAFCKPLLFLCAGLVLMRVAEQHDIRRLGGLRKAMPLASWGFVIGAASLSALPLVTAGYYSKEAVLSAAVGANGGTILWTAGAVGAALTGFYSFRALCLVFLGPARSTPAAEPASARSMFIAIPVVALAMLSLVGGVFAPQAGLLKLDLTWHGVVASAVAIAGIAAAWLVYGRRAARQAPAPAARPGVLAAFLGAGMGFDWLYDRLLVRPFVAVARAGRRDIFDVFTGLVMLAGAGLHRALSATQNGLLRWYWALVAAGAAVAIAVMVLT